MNSPESSEFVRWRTDQFEAGYPSLLNHLDSLDRDLPPELEAQSITGKPVRPPQGNGGNDLRD